MAGDIGLITAILGLAAALINMYYSREHRIKDDRRFREVHERLDGQEDK